MSGRRIATFTVTALVAGTLGFAAIATAGNATALFSPNDAFLAEITSEGIDVESVAEAVTNARHVCTALADGDSPLTLATEIQAGTEMTARQAAVFVASAMKNYCPR